jgi:hypothetical protein
MRASARRLDFECGGDIYGWINAAVTGMSQSGKARHPSFFCVPMGSGVGVKLTPTPMSLSNIVIAKSRSDCGNPDFQIATPCCARFAMTEKDKEKQTGIYCD